MGIVGLDQGFHFIQIQGSIGAVGDRLRMDRGQHRDAARFVAVAVRLHAEDHLFAAAAVAHQRGEVRLRAGGKKQRRLEAEHFRGALLQPVHRRVVAEHVIAELGLVHRLAHARRGTRDGIGTQIGDVAHAASLNRIIRRMPHEAELITTIAASLGLAMIMGFIAARMKMPPMAGYLLAGIIIGPATPGFVADVGLAGQLAEIGVMLLMFGVGLHFSRRRPPGGAQDRDSGRHPGDVRLDGAGHRRRAALGMGAGSGDRLWPRALGGEHRGGAAGARGRRRLAVHQRAHRRRLADRRGPGHGAGARAAAAPGRDAWR